MYYVHGTNFFYFFTFENLPFHRKSFLKDKIDRKIFSSYLKILKKKSYIFFETRQLYIEGEIFSFGKKMNKEGRKQYMRECKSFKMNARL